MLMPILFVADIPTVFAASAVPEPSPTPMVEMVKGEEVPSVASSPKQNITAGKPLKFVLRNVRFEHPQMVLNDVVLEQIMAPLLQRTITSEELNETVDKLTHYARAQGYPAALAYIPAQTAVKGEVVLRFEPGRLGKVRLATENALKPKVAKWSLAGLKSGDVIRSDKLEWAIRNLKDISGMEVKASLIPGENSGESDLEVSIANKDREAYLFYHENYGSKSAGRYRYGIQGDWRNINREGGRLNAGGLISNGNQRGYNITYESPVGHSFTTVGISYSHSDYELGRVWSQLGVEGKSDTVSLYGKTPLLNQTNHVLHLLYAANYRELIDSFHGIEFGDRHSYSISFGIEERFYTTSHIFQYNATLLRGRLTPDSAAAEALADFGGYTGGYTKATFDALFLQKLKNPFDLMVKISGQKAANNLDSSEHIYLGGARGVRAYPQGEAPGDEGVLGNIEWRYHTKLTGLTVSAYWDAGYIREAKSTHVGTFLQGWGLGLNYIKESNWFARVDYARRIGWDENLSQDAQSKQRWWFLVGKVF